MYFKPYLPLGLQKNSVSLATIAIIALLLIPVKENIADSGSPIQGVATKHLYNNVGGLNSKSSPTNLADTESSDLQNVSLDFHGAIRKRKGYSRYLTDAVSSGETVTGLVSFTNSSGTTLDIASAGRTLKYNSAGTWTNATTALTAGKIFNIAIGEDQVVFTNNNDRIQVWDGTGNTSDLIPFSGFEKARATIYHQGFLFLANVEVSGIRYPSRIYFSTQGDINEWNASDFLDINSNDGQPIIALAISNDILIIFKSDSIWALSGYGGFSPNSWSLRKVSSDIGCIATNSVVNIENELIFLSRKGVWGWTGTKPIDLSDKIQPTIDDLNDTQLANAVAGHIKKLNQYWISVPSSGSSTNDIVLVYDYTLGAWTKYSGIDASYFATWLVSSVPTLISGNYSGVVFKQDTGNTDDGAAINAYYDTKWFSFNDPIHRKKFRRLTTIVKEEGAYNLDLSAYLDFKGDAVVSSVPNVRTYALSLDGGGSKWGTAVWGQFNWGTGGQLIRETNMNRSGYWIKYRFENNGANQPFTIYGFSSESRVLQ